MARLRDMRLETAQAIQREGRTPEFVVVRVADGVAIRQFLVPAFLEGDREDRLTLDFQDSEEKKKERLDPAALFIIDFLNAPVGILNLLPPWEVRSLAFAAISNDVEVREEARRKLGLPEESRPEPKTAAEREKREDEEDLVPGVPDIVLEAVILDAALGGEKGANGWANGLAVLTPSLALTPTPRGRDRRRLQSALVPASPAPSQRVFVAPTPTAEPIVYL